MLSNNIIIEKIYDDGFFKARITCITTDIRIAAEYYISDERAKELCDTLYKVINADTVSDLRWSSGVRGNRYTPCIEFTFITANGNGHYLIEVFMELDNCSKYSKHTACFYVEAETSQLIRLQQRMQLVLGNDIGYIASFDE